MMSHLFPLLSLLLPRLIYLLDFIRGHAGRAYHDALSYAKFTSLRSSFPCTITRNGEKELPSHFHEVGRTWQRTSLGLTLGSFMDKAGLSGVWVEGRKCQSSCQCFCAWAPMPTTKCDTGQAPSGCWLNEQLRSVTTKWV